MNRCCRDSITFARLINEPTEGLEIACRWNDEYVRYERIAPDVCDWVVHEGRQTHEFVKREGAPEATEARERRYTEILGRERNRDV